MEDISSYGGAYVLLMEGNYNAGSVKSERRDNNRGDRVVAPFRTEFRLFLCQYDDERLSFLNSPQNGVIVCLS